MSLKTIKALFLIAAIYDLALGFVFGLFYRPIYQSFAVELPNHAGYVQLSAAFIFVFGIAFVWIWRDPIKNLPLISLGILMKLAFCVVSFGHLLVNWLPVFYIPFAILDLVFLILFWMARGAVKKLAVAN
jgi:CHASE2 domain-containing sensor protein